MHGETRVLPEFEGRRLRVPCPKPNLRVKAAWTDGPAGYREIPDNGLEYMVAEYVVRGTVAEFERWER